MTRYFGGHEVFSQSAYENSMKRAGRIMSGFQPYLLQISAGDDEAAFPSRYAGLREDDKTEEKLSASLAKLLWNCMEIHEDFKVEFADGDLSDKAKLNDFYVRAALKILVPNKP